jgi:outer membrane protein OmpA-like peptidoglycan-associated protein
MSGVKRSKGLVVTVASALLAILIGCATTGTSTTTRTTKRDKTAKGAAIGAAAGAAIGVLRGEREADEILAHTAAGAAIGAGVGAYMDAQEEKFGHIPGTTVERVSDDVLLIHFDSDVLFPIDSARLAPDARDSLDEMARVLNEYPKSAVVVQGYTDATGTEEHNQDLSERRAQAVKNYLVLRGVDEERMSALGFGESSPIASNSSESGRQRNRRVDILVKAKAR